MCRMLMIRDAEPFPVKDFLPRFAAGCQSSSEYQGDGWGAAYRRGGKWHHYKSLTPIWEDQEKDWGLCDFLILHARSAFRGEGIHIDNNMPFARGERWFVFNGELHGVRVKQDGRIGAEKIFNYILRLDQGDLGEGFRKAITIIRKRTDFVRGMNVLLTDGKSIHAATHHGSDHDYFTLYQRKGRCAGFASFPLDDHWQPLPNHSTHTI